MCLSMIKGRRRARAYASVAKGELLSVRITLPTDMKKLSTQEVLAAYFLRRGYPLEMSDSGGLAKPYPNVAPEPSIYCPNVLMGPFGPPPYLIMVNPPFVVLASLISYKGVILRGYHIRSLLSVLQLANKEVSVDVAEEC